MRWRCMPCAGRAAVRTIGIWFSRSCRTRWACLRRSGESLAKAHERRNLAEYEGHLEYDDQLLLDLLAATGLLLTAIHDLSAPGARLLHAW